MKKGIPLQGETRPRVSHVECCSRYVGRRLAHAHQAQIRELIDKCTWTWITYNYTVYGYKITGSNGNRIFIPAAGYRGGTSLYHAGSYGNYWSSTLYSYISGYASVLYFFSVYRYVDCKRFVGLSVRPVKEK